MKINNIRIKYVIIFLLVVAVLFILISANRKKSPGEPSGYNISNDVNRNTDTVDETNEVNTKPSDDTDSKDIKVSGTGAAENKDWEFGQMWKEIYRKYPWYRKFPIENDKYGIVWVIEEESFRIVLKIGENSLESVKKELINQALKDIEEATGMSSKNFDYYVRYTN